MKNRKTAKASAKKPRPESAKRAAPEPGDARWTRLVHELEVHQVELEAQNEQLRAARTQTEAALQRYSELFDFAPIAYATLAPEGTIRELNHAAAALLGADRGRLVSQNLLMFFRAAKGLSDFLGDSRAGTQLKQIKTCELEVTTVRLERRVLKLSATALAGSPPGLLLAIEDITERNDRARQLADAEHELRDAARHKDEFLAALSHELRNPLAPIRNSLDVLERVEPGGESARQARRVIDRQANHLIKLVEDLLDVTRISRGKVRLHLECVELVERVRHTMEDCRSSFERRGVFLAELAGPDELWIEADPTRLVQAVSNVLSNAEKFTPSGGKVTVRMAREGSRAVVTVRDTGAGIAPELLEHIFEPFAQAPQTLDRAHGGLGLGLAVVKGLVELQGGEVRITSGGLNRGTELTLTWPLAQAPAPRPVRAEQVAARARRVLVIDDNADAADAVQSLLESHGHQVEVAYSGNVGVEHAKTFRPEVIICDIGLPGMDGYAVARAIRSEPTLRGVFLIALSGYAQPEDVRRASEAGFDLHLSKPTSIERIEAALEQVSSGAEPHLLD